MVASEDKTTLQSFGLTASQITKIARLTRNFTQLDFKKMQQIEDIAIRRDKYLRAANKGTRGVFHYEIGHFLIRKALVHKLKKEFKLTDQHCKLLDGFIGKYHHLYAVHPASEAFTIPEEEMLKLAQARPNIMNPLRRKMISFLKSILPESSAGELKQSLQTDMFDKPAVATAGRESLAFIHPEDKSESDEDKLSDIFHGDYLAYEIANANFDRMLVHEHIRAQNPDDERLKKIRRDIAESTRVAEMYQLDINRAMHDVLKDHIGEVADLPIDFYHSNSWTNFIEKCNTAVQREKDIGNVVPSRRFNRFKTLATRVKNHAVLERIYPAVKMRY